MADIETICGVCGFPVVPRRPTPEGGDMWGPHDCVTVLRAEVGRLRRVEWAAQRLVALHELRDRMIADDTWESEGAIPIYRAIANAETRLRAGLSGGNE